MYDSGAAGAICLSNDTEVLFHRVLHVGVWLWRKSKNSVSSNMQMVYMLIRLTVNGLLKDFLKKGD
jgi:hypothetical protein